MAEIRTIYHSVIKLAFGLGLEKEWLPQEFLETIPRSTSHPWKSLSKEKFAGSQYAEKIGGNVEDLRLLYHKNVQFEKRLFLSVMRLKIAMVEMIGKEQVKHTYKENYREVVRLIESSKNSFKGGVNAVCSYLDIKPRVYYYWRSIAKHKCEESMQEICVKKVPSQASKKEIDSIKNLLTSSSYLNWGICSIWGYAIRTNQTALSLSSWYKYNQKYRFRIKPKKGIFKPQYNSILTTRPNEKWHIDVTIFKSEDGHKNYIYFIQDNFSRTILNTKVSSECSGKVRMQTLREAVEQEFGKEVLQKSFSNNDQSNLPLEIIADGGTENNNRTVEEFIKETQIDITKVVALQDIKESNSVIEAVNKTIKYSYLFREKIPNQQALIKHLTKAVYDFNYLRPNYRHGIYTPAEVHYDKKPTFVFKPNKEIIKERCTFHKTLQCSQDCC